MNGSDAIAMILGSLQQNVQQVQSDVNQKGEIFAAENEVPIVDLDGNLKSSKLKQVSTGVSVEGDILIQSSGKLAVGSSNNYGTTGQVLTSNSTTDSPSWETMTFTKLSDTPENLGTSGQVAQINSTGDALEFVNVPTHVNTAIDAAINGLISSAPGTLDTLDEIAAALGDDADFHNTVNNAIANKQNLITSTSRLDTALVGDGSVDNTELSHLNGVTSSIQTQIDSKEPTLPANQKIPWDTDQTSNNYKIHTNNLPFATSNSVGGIKLGDGLAANPLDSSEAIVSVGNGITISNGVVELSENFTTQPSGVYPAIRLEYIPLQSGGGLSKTNNELHLTDESFTSTEKTKLSGIATGAEVNVQSDWNATAGDALILNKPTLVTAFTDLSDTSANLGTAGQVVQVNAGGTALEFATPSGGASDVDGLSDGKVNNTTSYLIGSRNTAMVNAAVKNACYGYDAGRGLTSGAGNVMLGFEAGLSATTGSGHVVIGREAYRAGIGSNNVAVGHASMNSFQGHHNTAMGYNSMRTNAFNGNCFNNTAIGVSAMHNANNRSLGNTNTAIGGASMYYGTEGHHNTCIGHFANVGNDADASEYETVIGADASGNGSNTVTIGHSAVTRTYFGTGGVSIPHTIGTAGQVLTVNASANALEFATPSSGGGGLSVYAYLHLDAGTKTLVTSDFVSYYWFVDYNSNNGMYQSNYTAAESHTGIISSLTNGTDISFTIPTGQTGVYHFDVYAHFQHPGSDAMLHNIDMRLISSTRGYIFSGFFQNYNVPNDETGMSNYSPTISITNLFSAGEVIKVSVAIGANTNRVQKFTMSMFKIA